MTEYIEVINDSGKLAISRHFNSWKLKSIGTLGNYRIGSGSISPTFFFDGGTENAPSTNYGYLIPSTANDISVISNNSNTPVYIFGDYINEPEYGKGLLLCVMAATASLADDLKVLTFENTKPTDTGSCGINIFDESQQLLFSSNEKALRPITSKWVNYVSSPQVYYREGDALQDRLHDSRNRITLSYDDKVIGFLPGRCCSSRCFSGYDYSHLIVAIVAKLTKNTITTGEVTASGGVLYGWGRFQWGEQAGFSVVNVNGFFSA